MLIGGAVSAGEIGQMNEIIDPVLAFSAKVGSRTIRLAALQRGGRACSFMSYMHTVREGLLLFMFMSCNIF